MTLCTKLAGTVEASWSYKLNIINHSGWPLCFSFYDGDDDDGGGGGGDDDGDDKDDDKDDNGVNPQSYIYILVHHFSLLILLNDISSCKCICRWYKLSTTLCTAVAPSLISDEFRVKLCRSLYDTWVKYHILHILGYYEQTCYWKWPLNGDFLHLRGSLWSIHTIGKLMIYDLYTFLLVVHSLSAHLSSKIFSCTFITR